MLPAVNITELRSKVRDVYKQVASSLLDLQG